MDDLAVAQIDGHVGDADGFLVGGFRAEEHQVGGLQVAEAFRHVDRLAGLELLRRVAQEHVAVEEVDGLGEAAAVHALDGGAGPEVRHADKGLGGLEDQVAGFLHVLLRGVGRNDGLAAVDPGAEVRHVGCRHEGVLAVRKADFRIFAGSAGILHDVAPDTVAHVVGIGPRRVEEEGVEVGDHHSLRRFPGIEARLVDGHDGHVVDPGLVAVRGFDVHPIAVVAVVHLDGRAHQGLGAEFGGILGIFPHVDDGKGGESQAVFVFPFGLGCGILCFLFGGCAAEDQCGAEQEEE